MSRHKMQFKRYHHPSNAFDFQAQSINIVFLIAVLIQGLLFPLIGV